MLDFKTISDSQCKTNENENHSQTNFSSFVADELRRLCTRYRCQRNKREKYRKLKQSLNLTKVCIVCAAQCCVRINAIRRVKYNFNRHLR